MADIAPLRMADSSGESEEEPLALAGSTPKEPSSPDPLDMPDSASDMSMATSSGESMTGDLLTPPARGGGVTPPRRSSAAASAMTLATSGGFGGPDDLTSAFSWAHVAWTALRGLVGREEMSSGLLGSHVVMSSHFSGVGTAELAMTFLEAALPGAVGLRMRVTPAFACESARRCQEVLLSRMPSQRCVFRDVLDVSEAASRLFAASAARVDYEQVQRTILAGGVTSSGRCVRHSRACERLPVNCDIAGSPCTPWSSAGLRAGKTDRLVILFLTWSRWLLHARPIWALHENVRNFDDRLLTYLLGSQYEVVSLRTSPADVGFACVQRKRTYTVLLLRERTKLVADLAEAWRHLQQAFAARGVVSFSSCFVATGEELRAEENKWRRRRGLAVLAQTAPISRDWSYLLTPWQRARLQNYHAMSPNADAFNLGQNPGARPGIALHGRLPTITRNSGLWWVPRLGRWMVAKELAAASGYPVTEELAAAAGVPIDTHSYTPGQIGNCMHVANVGCVMAVVLASVRLQ